ncbi:MAG: hypothetical protein EOO77_46400 [Oxalobacteraceae bacterium]|nr:MAG: hypothetical protein EOO77_46400 [Oxalobacteraceae bacterium]
MRAKLVQTNGGNTITQIGAFELTVTGRHFPVPTTGIRLEIVYRDIIGVDAGGNPIYTDKIDQLLAFDAVTDGTESNFQKTVNFNLPMLIAGTSIVIDQGVTVRVTTGARVFTLPMSNGTDASMQ